MASRQLYHFKKGQKEIYLPNFIITFIRSPFLPPTYAKFVVPLNFNKLDIRDYLFHGYGIRVLKVRSFVDQQAVLTNAKGQKKRPMAKKIMTVEMDSPFVWPDIPEDFDAWDKETYDAASEDEQIKQFAGAMGPVTVARRKPHDRKSIAEQAKALLDGKEKWKPTWQALGKEVEYEQKDWTGRR